MESVVVEVVEVVVVAATIGVELSGSSFVLAHGSGALGSNDAG